MGVVIGRMDGQVEKIFLGNNLTRSTKNYAKILKDENLSEEEKQSIQEYYHTQASLSRAMARLRVGHRQKHV